MANSRGFHQMVCWSLIAGALIASESCWKVEAGGGERQWGWIPAKGGCGEGSIAECMAQGEVEMESEISRRILATSNYISYGALQRNTVPCSRRGASYYNCQPGAEANPYTRGCSAITRCRS